MSSFFLTFSSIQSPRCWITADVLTSKVVENTFQLVSWNSPFFSPDIFFQSLDHVRVVVVDLLLQVAPEEVVLGVEIGEIWGPWVVGPPRNLPVPCKGTVSSTEECCLNSKGVHHPVETQLFSCQLPSSSSLRPVWSVSSASQCTVQSQLSPGDHSRLQQRMNQRCTPHSCLFYSQECVQMLMRVCSSPNPHVLLIHMLTQVEMCLVTEKNTFKRYGTVLNPFADALAKFIAFFLVGLAFCTLYGNSFRSLWMVLIIKLLEIPTSCDSRLVDFRGDCSK